MSEIDKTCCFFGHRNLNCEIKPDLIKAIKDLIENHGVTHFYVGNQGQFDSLVISALKDIYALYPKIDYAVVLAYLPGKDSKIDLGHTIYPEGIENVPKRFCISWRNNWLVKNSRYVICYVAHITGGAFSFKEKAKKKGRTVVNLADKL